MIKQKVVKGVQDVDGFKKQNLQLLRLKQSCHSLFSLLFRACLCAVIAESYL